MKPPLLAKKHVSFICNFPWRKLNVFSTRNSPTNYGGILYKIVKTSSLQRMPLEQITAYINETEFEMVLESVSRRLHAFYAILYVLKVFFNILLHSFQTEIAVLQRECTKSGGTLFMDYHVLKTIRLGFIDFGCLYTKKMLNPYPKCTLFALFLDTLWTSLD